MMMQQFGLDSIRLVRMIICTIIGILVVTPAIAEEQYGRYRAIVLYDGGQSTKSGNLIPKVFIMDSQEGHMWVLDQNTKLNNLNGRFSLGTVLTYQGQVRPGKKMGEIVEQAAILR